jgi:hypothetical protein
MAQEVSAAIHESPVAIPFGATVVVACTVTAVTIPLGLTPTDFEMIYLLSMSAPKDGGALGTVDRQNPEINGRRFLVPITFKGCACRDCGTYTHVPMNR